MAYGRSKRDVSPCYDCTEKYQACHSKCDRFDIWLKKQRDKKFKISQSLNPKECHYFKERSNSKLAPKSKKRYR